MTLEEVVDTGDERVRAREGGAQRIDVTGHVASGFIERAQNRIHVRPVKGGSKIAHQVERR